MIRATTGCGVVDVGGGAATKGRLLVGGLWGDWRLGAVRRPTITRDVRAIATPMVTTAARGQRFIPSAFSQLPWREVHEVWRCPGGCGRYTPGPVRQGPR